MHYFFESSKEGFQRAGSVALSKQVTHYGIFGGSVLKPDSPH